MAEAISIYFVQPLILTALSAVFLGEQIRQRRIIAIIIGLLGVVIILQPSLVIFGFRPFSIGFRVNNGRICNDYTAIGRKGTPVSNAVHR